MSEYLSNKTPPFPPDYIGEIHNLVQWINSILSRYSDKDWNYSRVRLQTIGVTSSQSPYLLRCELINLSDSKGKRELKDVLDELTWGENHSRELGILELISLRVNRALIESVGDKLYESGNPPKRCHPVLRLVKRQELIAAGISVAIWYEVEEVAGEDFENR